MKRIRYSLTLIEMVIALGLFALLISSLFFWYHRIQTQKQRLGNLYGPLIEERYARQCLTYIFQNIHAPLVSTPQGICFLFDRGTWCEPTLSGTCLGHLYHDPNKHALVLSIWPNPEENSSCQTPYQTAILLDRVEAIDYMFFHPPTCDPLIVKPDEVKKPVPREGWQERWPLTTNFLPALISLKITRAPCGTWSAPILDTRVIEYCFDLPPAIIYYPELS